jgi:hypothetical protein
MLVKDDIVYGDVSGAWLSDHGFNDKDERFSPVQRER